jgi:hypothetical protein
VKTFSLFSLLLLAGTHVLPAEDIVSTLTFADKTRITGQTLSIDQKKKTLTFTSPSLQGETQLKTEDLLEMTLDGTPKTIEADHYALATIKPHNDLYYRDTLRGSLVQLDDETVTIDTWYAGQLTLKRSLVHALDIFAQAPTFYTGPNGPEGWVTSSGEASAHWAFKNRTMVTKTRQGIAREVEIPERAKITITAHWKNSPSFSILFLTDQGADRSPNSGYSLNLSQNRLNLYRFSDNPRSNLVFNETIESMREVEKTTITIYLDRTKEGTSAVYLDDKRSGTWTDADDTAIEGKWLSFMPYSSSPLKLSGISVSQWDGTLPLSAEEEPTTEEDDPKQEGQKIRLANGDIVIGKIQKIDKEIVKLGTSFGDVQVPLRLMKSINLDEVEDEDRMEINDVRAWFHEGGYVTIKLKSFDGKTIKGYSQVYGDAEFQLSAFSRIQFNIWDIDLDPARISGETDDW